MAYELHLDFETRSDLDLKTCGLHAYAEHPSTDILCLAYQREGDIEPTLWFPGDPAPLPVEDFAGARRLHGWNVAFERAIWEHIAVPRYGFPAIEWWRWCNEAQDAARASNLPASLDGAAAALDSEQRKDEAGAKLMKRMAKGLDITPENLWRLGRYCQQDVRTEIAIGRRTGTLPEAEPAVALISEMINNTGVKIDRPFVELAARAVHEYQTHISTMMVKRFGFGPRQVQEIRKFCARHNAPQADVRADTVDNVMELAEFYPEPVVEMLQLRQKAAAAAPGKYKAMLRAVSSDDRLRGMFTLYGAGQTGRWSGRIVQLHNLARPTMELADVLRLMDELRRVQHWQCLGDDPLDVLLNALRPSLIPGTGGCFTAGDESAIEARVIAWLAGCKPVLDVFAGGGDIYLHAAETIYHRPVTKADKAERQIGKVATLALGFGGGKRAFVTMGRGYGVKVPETEAEKIKKAWRLAHPQYVMLWAVLDVMAQTAMLKFINDNPGFKDKLRKKPEENAPSEDEAGVYSFSIRHLKGATESPEEMEARLRDMGIAFSMTKDGAALVCRLPSKRCITYQAPSMQWGVQRALAKLVREENPSMSDDEVRKASARWRISFWSPEGDRMRPNGTYGGKLSENLTQAIARDVLANAMMEFGGPGLVMHVHDELVAEGRWENRMREALTAQANWMKRGIAPLPLAAEITELERYWK